VLRASLKSSVCGAHPGWLSLDGPGHETDCSNLMNLADTLIATLFPAGKPAAKFRLKVYADQTYGKVAGSGTEGNGVYSNLRVAAPVSTAEFSTAPFPSLTTGALANLAAFGPNGSLTLSWTAPSQVPVLYISANVISDQGNLRNVSTDSAVGLSEIKMTGGETTDTAGAANYRSATLQSRDADGRNYWTKYYGCGGGSCY
jgi:hypothetical protein